MFCYLCFHISHYTSALFLTILFLENQDGSAKAVKRSEVPADVIQKVDRLKAGGHSLHDAIAAVRSDLAPSGFEISPWRPHCTETTEDAMKTVLAVYRYKAKLTKYQKQGVDFLHNLFVPEDDDHREDHNHLVKRIGFHTRDGRFGQICVSKFEEAMKAGLLTHAALVGSRKQSVKDAEKLLSHHVAAFFKEKGYDAEGEYVEVIANWHEATDGRGMQQEQRAAANAKMLQYIMQDWTPWWTSSSDMSEVDINR